ncbi:PQQ-binding-like beta-propeller repeat protein [Streptomyces fructofermentans]|uniref:outer membrane protein assembly factor BamB family protein n=1 Tax=Streptomyces fructofermentans TaxID=152141 RepID=UPI0033C2D879
MARGELPKLLLGDPAPPPWERHLLYAAMAIVLAMIPLVLLQQDRDDLVTGAQGSLPAALGTEVPVAPDHVVRRKTHLDEVLVGGLAVHSTDAGLKAADARTGEEFWHYERGDVDSAAALFDVSDRTVVNAYWDGELVGVDLRTGRRLWRETVRDDGIFQAVDLVGGQALTQTTGAVRAYDERDGHSLWTMRAPASCKDLVVPAAYALPDHLTVLGVICDRHRFATRSKVEEYNLLIGVDNRSGEALWQQPIGDPKLITRAGERTLSVPTLHDGAEEDRLLDVDRGGTTPRAVSLPRSWDRVGSESGTVLLVDGTPEEGLDDRRATALRGYDTGRSRTVWRLEAPAGQEYGKAVIADGRAYVVRQPFVTGSEKGRRVRGELLVLDTGTGDVLHTLRLPVMAVPDEYWDDQCVTLDVRDVVGGAVAVQWEEGNGDLLVATG